MLTAPDPAPESGFTLIELLVAIVIAGILAAVALPSFTEFIQRGQVRTAAESVQNALQLARGEAVRRNEHITFILATGTGATSWTVQDNAPTPVQIQASRASGEGSATVTAVQTPAGATSATFNGFGRIVANADASATLTKVVVGSAGTALTMQVEVESTGGQIRMCDPGITTAGDPRRCLQ